jgi:hypothetical protein
MSVLAWPREDIEMSDAVLQDLIVRMAADPAFADQVRANPSLLGSYDLTAEERGSLAALTGDTGSGVEGLATRQSKSVLFPMMGGHDAHAGMVQQPSHVDLGGHHPGQGGEHHISSGGDHDVSRVHHKGFDPSHTKDVGHLQQDKWTPVGDKHMGGPLQHDKWMPMGDKAQAHIDAGHVKLDLSGAKIHSGDAQAGGSSGILIGLNQGEKIHPGDAQGLNPQPLPPMPGGAELNGDG